MRIIYFFFLEVLSKQYGTEATICVDITSSVSLSHHINYCIHQVSSRSRCPHNNRKEKTKPKLEKKMQRKGESQRLQSILFLQIGLTVSITAKQKNEQRMITAKETKSFSIKMRRMLEGILVPFRYFVLHVYRERSGRTADNFTSRAY